MDCYRESQGPKNADNQTRGCLSLDIFTQEINTNTSPTITLIVINDLENLAINFFCRTRVYSMWPSTWEELGNILLCLLEKMEALKLSHPSFF